MSQSTAVCIVIASKVDGEWQNKTYKQYYNDVVAAAKSLIEVCAEMKQNYMIFT